MLICTLCGAARPSPGDECQSCGGNPVKACSVRSERETCLRRDRDEARQRVRRAAQSLIVEIGAPGPEGIGETASRAVAVIVALRADVETLTCERDEAMATAKRRNADVTRWQLTSDKATADALRSDAMVKTLHAEVETKTKHLDAIVALALKAYDEQLKLHRFAKPMLEVLDHARAALAEGEGES